MRPRLLLLTLIATSSCCLLPSAATAAVAAPQLENRAYQAIVQSALARVPVHNPEWTNFNEGDVVWVPRHPGPVFGSLITLTPQGHVAPAEPCAGCPILD